MRRFAAGLVVGVLALLVLAQLLLPAYLEERVGGRLTEEGSAEVSLGAFPALRLLADEGERFEVRGRGLRFVPGRGGQVLATSTASTKSASTWTTCSPGPSRRAASPSTAPAPTSPTA